MDQSAADAITKIEEQLAETDDRLAVLEAKVGQHQADLDMVLALLKALKSSLTATP